MSNPILDAALSACEHGLKVIPIHQTGPEGDKRPAIRWKTTRLDTEASIHQWWDSDQYGLAIAMGEASNGLIMIELEGAHAHKLPQLAATFQQAGMKDLWVQLTAGWFEQSPSGGYHWYAYAPGNTSGNRKLARTPNKAVIAETRENGGYSVIAPTDGRFHASGKPWARISGSPATAITLTPDQLDDVLAIFRTLDETPAAKPVQRPTIERRTEDGITPGDDYEAKTSWAQILEPHGWKPAFTRGQETFWSRPGKQHGISASTGHATDRDRLYVWSSSTDFDTEVPYTKFAAYAVLNHDGDYTRAAKALAAEGYGQESRHYAPIAQDRDLDTWITNNRTDVKQPERREATAGDDTALTENGKPASETAGKAEKTEEQAQTVIEEPVEYTRTDDGNALRFADAYTGQFRWIPQKETWAAWDGSKWNIEDGKAQAVEAARQLMRALPQDDKLDITHRKRSLSNNAINAMLSLAHNTAGIYTPLQNFDTNPYLLNTPKGTVDLHTGVLTPPNPAVLCLRSTTIAPDFNMPTPRWNRFLDQTFLGDTSLITYMQRFFGMCVLGKTAERILPFLHGAGANGKSTMLNVIQTILGIGATGYTLTSPAEILTQTNRHPADIAALQGIRLAIIAELEERARIAEAKTKELTGGDNLTARFMGKDFFTFTPTHNFVILTNNVPDTGGGGSQALWRRIRNIPFPYVVPKNERDPNLETKLLTEAPGILAWIIKGTIDYLQHGLPEPGAVTRATAAYEAEQNTVAQFLTECCTLHDANRDLFQVRKAELRSKYETWCRINGYTPVGQKQLTQRLERAGVGSTKGTHGARYFIGITIDADPSLEEVIL